MSVETITLDPPKAGEVLVEMAASGMCHSDDHARTGDLPAIPPLIGRDLESIDEATRILAERSAADLLDVVRRAGRIFAEETLPLGPGNEQSPADYLDCLAATTGMPIALGKMNLARIRGFMEE